MKLHTKILIGMGLGVVFGMLVQSGVWPEGWRSVTLDILRLFADLFMALLKMLIIPIVLTSIISGVAGLTGRDLGRMGLRTFLYYMVTSLLAIAVGLTLVNVFEPGAGGVPGLADAGGFEEVREMDPLDSFRNAVPTNVFQAFSDNSNMLQVIIFALLFGYFISRTPDEPRRHMTSFIEGAFAVMMEMAKWVLGMLPIGVFFLLAKVVAETGLGVFEPLLAYMAVVVAALLIHALIMLSLVLKLGAGQSPLGWLKVMNPALLTAFSTSSSALTLPVNLETVEKRGGVSNRVTSFVLPLGATVNMDGTALYECIGVIFLSQAYAAVGGVELSFGSQIFIVVLALLASIGAAGIPSAGLVMMITILSALNLPTEGAALLLAVDRPLDMLRTTVNVYSDSVAARCVARLEGERVVPSIT